MEPLDLLLILLLGSVLAFLYIRGRERAGSGYTVPEPEDDPIHWTDPARVEAEMACWLASPEGFGTRPDVVRLRRTYQVGILGFPDANFHLVEYCLPDGTYGRGCVGLSTRAFRSGEDDGIEDDDLVRAYVGWQWILESKSCGIVVTDFASNGSEAVFLARKDHEGLTELEVTGRYRVGDTEVFEYRGNGGGVAVRGAGADADDEVSFTADDPLFALPPVYFHFARHLIDAIH